jgi:trypsin-like peptidase
VKLSAIVVSFAITALAMTGYVEVQAVTLDDLSVTVAYLKEGDNSGTGFFVALELPGLAAIEQPYLVTASHVARHLTRNSTVTFRAPGDVPVSLLLKDLISGDDELAWQVHGEADVAVLKLKLNDNTIQMMRGRFLKFDLIAVDENAPQRERPVMVMGFPLGLGTTGRFSPVTSEAKPASGLLRVPRGDTKKEATFFILDKPSIGGFSGAPVFQLPGPFASGGALVFQELPARTIVVGLVHGTMSDNTGGKLALIIPSKFIRDTILQADRAEKGSRNH